VEKRFEGRNNKVVSKGRTEKIRSDRIRFFYKEWGGWESNPDGVNRGILK
jgi:hypothetical protein